MDQGVGALSKSLPPLLLDGIEVTRVSFQCPDQAPSGPPRGCAVLDQYRVRVDFDVVTLNQERTRVRVPLALRFTAIAGKGAPFESVHIDMAGEFSATDPEEPESFRRLVPLNCLAILHGAARGLLLAATASCPAGPFVLPTVNFVAEVERKLRRIKRAEARKTAADEDARDA
ncbi:MAG: protein-export chaperone SecB [Armatimonadetes bacterium]|nr:protein-export chaperone SecB [Armatimonadota bacterium]